MVYLFFSGIGTLKEVYPNFYLNITIFTFIYVIFLKINKTFINSRNKKINNVISNVEPGSFLKVFYKIYNLSNGKHFANYLCIISLISGWLLLLESREYAGLFFITFGMMFPIAASISEHK